MGGEALAAVADPGLAVVADGADHGQAGGVLAGVADDAVARLHHALDLAALGADGKPGRETVDLIDSFYGDCRFKLNLID